MYLDHCVQHYRKNGEITSEVCAIKITLRHTNRLYRSTPPPDFSPPKLKAVWETVIDAHYVRPSINQHVGRIRRMFQWGMSEECVLVEILMALETWSRGGGSNTHDRFVEAEMSRFHSIFANVSLVDAIPLQGHVHFDYGIL